MRKQPLAPAFTLVELIVVMALLAIVMAVAAPSLSRSLRQRHVDEQATRFLALTEYARDEAISQGVPTVIWFDPGEGRFGVQAKAGFEGDDSRFREFSIDPDIQFGLDKADRKNGVIEAIEFAPDGMPSTASVELIDLQDRFGSAVSVVRTTDRWAYQIVKETK